MRTHAATSRVRSILSRRVGPASLRWATCVATPSSAWRRRWAKARSSCRPCTARSARPESGRRAHELPNVDLVDLLRTQVAVRVLPPHAGFEEEVEEVRVDVLVAAHEAHDLQRLR